MRFYQLSPENGFSEPSTRVTSYHVSLLDPDNLAGGIKILWDALTAAGVIFDDGPKFLTAIVGQVPVRKKRDERTAIRLTVF